MKVRALKKFEGIKDLERNVFPKENDVWETSEERAEFLKSHGVIEYVEEEKDVFEKYAEEIKKEEATKVEEKPKKKKNNKKKKGE